MGAPEIGESKYGWSQNNDKTGSIDAVANITHVGRFVGRVRAGRFHRLVGLAQKRRSRTIAFFKD